MPRPEGLRHMIGGLVFLILFNGPAEGQVSIPIDDDAALRVLAEQYYAACTQKDVNRLSPFWSSKSPNAASTLQAMRQWFADKATIELKNLRIRRTNVKAENASVIVEVDIQAIVAKTGKPAPSVGKIRILDCVREAGSWKIWREDSAQSDLAARLSEAKTPEERTSLLSEERELLSPGLGQALVWRADYLRRKGSYARAREIYELAQSISERIADKSGMADAFQGLGWLHLDQGEDEPALAYFEKGLALREALGDDLKIAQSLSIIASLYVTRNKRDLALELSQRSLKLRQTTEDKPAIARGFGDLGYIYSRRDDPNNALDYFRKSLALYEEVGDTSSIAWTHREIGLVHYQQRNYVRALESYQRSFALFQQLQAKSDLAQTLYNLGVVHRSLGNFDQALDYYQKSLKLREELGAKGAISGCYYSMGNVYGARGNYSRALASYQKAMELWETLGDRHGMALALNGMGNIYADQGGIEEGLALLQKSLDIYQALAERRGIAAGLSNIGVRSLTQGAYDKAKDYFLKSLEIYEALKDRSGMGLLLGNMGYLYHVRHDNPRALEYYTRSLALSEELGEKQQSARTLESMGAVHHFGGNNKSALELALRASRLAEEIGDRETLWRAYSIQAQAHRSLNQPDRARTALTNSISVIESLRDDVAGDEQKRERFFEDKVSPYRAMTEMLIEQNLLGEAFSWLERAKARVLLDVLQSERANINKAMTARETEQEQRLNNQIASLNSQITSETLRKSANRDRVADLQAQREKARLERDAFETNLYAAHPELKVQRGEARPLMVDDAAQLLQSRGSIVLEFLVMESKTYLFVLRRKENSEKTDLDLKVHRLEAESQELATRVEHFRKQLSERDPEFQRTSAELYTLLLKPAAEQLKGVKSVVIVPDGVLWELPFQALITGGRYFLEDREVSYAPSLTVLRQMTALRDRRAVGAPSPPKLLAFGNPVLSGAAANTGNVLSGGTLSSALPETEEQIKRIGSFFGARSTIHLGSEATEDRFKREAGEFDILHLAAHGVLSQASPMYSHVILSPDRDGREDGLLEAREVMRLNLKAKLAVLSACETARGRVGAGEGMIGLAWALFVAGCPAAIVSQWKVDAASTTELMVEFYRQLRPGNDSPGQRLSKAAALRQAALTLMRSDRYRHPFYWAGFVLIGDNH